MDTVKIDDKWYEKMWHWTGTKTDAGLGYSLRPLSEFESQLAEQKERN